MKLVNIFAAVSMATLALGGCVSTTSNGGAGGAGGTSTGGTSTGGTSTGGTSTGGTSTGGTSTGGTSTGGSGGMATGGSGGGGQCSEKTATCQQIGFDKSADGSIGPCTSCMRSKCCTAINGCFQDTTCSGLNVCINANCATAKTVQELQTCVQQNCNSCGASAISKFNGVGQCMTQNCKTECGGGAPADGGASADGGI